MNVLHQPLWLLGLLVVPLLALAYAVGRRGSARRLDKLVGPSLGGRLARVAPGWLGPVRVGLVLLFVTCAVLALARPRWGRELRDVTTFGVDVLVLFDVSRSMDVADVSPNRLDLAKAFVSALAERPASDRLGLVAFAGSAHLMCPLTVDRSAFRLFLESLTTSLVPRPGSDLGGAISKGVALLANAPGDPMLVIVSDGEALAGDPLAAATSAAEAGVRIHTVGVGTPSGQPIPLRDESGAVEDYQKDAEGKVVTSRLDERTLRAISAQTGGRYVPLAAGMAAVRALAEELAAHPAQAREIGELENRPEQYQWPLAVGVLALILEVMLGLVIGARRLGPRAEGAS